MLQLSTAKAYINSLLTGKTTQLKPLNDLIKEMDPSVKRIVEAINYNNPLFSIRSFFSETSKWHDYSFHNIIQGLTTYNSGQYDLIIAKLKELEAAFSKAGRDEYGINRTKVGEEVTDEKIFLGGIHGVWTFSLQDIKKENDNKDFLNIVTAQAKSFMISYKFIETKFKELKELIQVL